MLAAFLLTMCLLCAVDSTICHSVIQCVALVEIVT